MPQDNGDDVKKRQDGCSMSGKTPWLFNFKNNFPRKALKIPPPEAFENRLGDIRGIIQRGHLLASLWVPHCPAAQEPNHSESFLDSAFLMEATCGCVTACMCL